ncbi:hypothetical protein [Streptomyces violascens]|uniref:Uncharacterized protein n=1 Tax=Streptomyces violascens TaxID=67381 RepID=A0ABQ3QTC2_9ACTN|nr:hypothetical protein [Streptomyces violascens]GHI40536.1 hypothetical protein Sviol_49440 [Streptomyces violascens]
MQPAVLQAIESWEQSWNQAQASAVSALKSGFPFLVDQSRYVGCDDIRLQYAQAGLGEGRVCLDDEARVSIEFQAVPNTVITQAVDEIQFPYLDHSEGSLRDAPPGAYVYLCESSNAEFEFVVGAGGHGQVNVSFARVPDATAVLDALTGAFSEQHPRARQSET